MAIVKFDGYHGTSYKNASIIVESDYKRSLGDDEWLGDGVYFFINGLSTKPKEQAKKWAIAQAWDKTRKKHSYKEYGIIKSVIEVDEDNFLDLTNEEGIEFLQYLIKRFRNKLNNKFKNLEGSIINLARGEKFALIDVVKGNFYIKFAEERKKNINLRTNNCTICTVYDVKSVIQSKQIVNFGYI